MKAMPNVSTRTLQWVVGIVVAIVLSLMGVIYDGIERRLDKQDKDIDTLLHFIIDNN